jgi:hypothetical protein
MTRQGLRLWMIGAMLISAAPELASESVTLTTYYPAPSGVYTNLITTGNTFLARDGVTQVGIGTPAPTAKLHIISDQSAGQPIPLKIQGNGSIMFGIDNVGAARFAINNDVGPLLNFYGSDVGWFNFMSVNNAGTRVTSFNAGSVGINTTTPTQKLDVNGAIATVDVVTNNASCGPEALYNIYGTFQCAAGQYITVTSGVMANLTVMPLYQNLGGGLAPVLCCPCPGGVCPLLP